MVSSRQAPMVASIGIPTKVGARTINRFKKTIWDYYRTYGRHDLPWRHTTDPYKILISEIMLQQTQVSRVLKKYPEFLKAFPSFEVLANAPLEDVLRVWQGMGYNRRALYLKQIAQRVVNEFSGKLPRDPEILVTFPGIGKNTAGSTIAFAFNKPVVFVETNIRRVFIHFFFDDKTGGIEDKEILKLVEQVLDKENSCEWYWALMDYGAMLGMTIENPNKRSKHYSIQSKFEGSNRQLRGKILKLLLQSPRVTEKEIIAAVQIPPEKIQKILEQLMQEGFIEKVSERYQMASK